jgi:pimeloyl-ACP methyl ester carboxylesterase
MQEPTSVQLYYRQSGSELHPPLLFLHGLFGSSANWGRIVRHFEKQYRCIVPDLRNHGRSPHHADVSYHALAEDVGELMRELSLESAHLVGHSMGGKAAMVLALLQPHRIGSLVVVDIAPVDYAHSFSAVVGALGRIDLRDLARREEADAQLSSTLPDAALRAYLLQNLVKSEGRWRWRVGLENLAAGATEIISFPRMQGRSFAGDTLFLYGERSGYVDDRGQQAARRLFPRAAFIEVEDAGHWLYAEQPQQFIHHLERFLS